MKTIEAFFTLAFTLYLMRLQVHDFFLVPSYMGIGQRLLLMESTIAPPCYAQLGKCSTDICLIERGIKLEGLHVCPFWVMFDGQL